MPTAAEAAGGSSGDGDLSPRLAELAKPSVRSAPAAKQAEELSLPAEGPGSLLRKGNRVLVEARFDHGAVAGAGALRTAGAKIFNVSARYQTVTIAAKPSELSHLLAVDGLDGLKEVLTPIAAATECPSGTTVSEGDEQLRAAEARGEFGVDGAGITVGILSDSFDLDESAETDAGEDAKTGDLPGAENPCGQPNPTDVIEEYDPGPEDPEPTDEGRGMAQIVHDLAPGAELAFASAFNGELAFAENIERLAMPISEGGAEAQVIADDVFYPDEPFFQDGPVAVAANKVNEEGDIYLSAAGNNNLIDSEDNDIASWETERFRDSGGCPGGSPTYAKHCLDFDPGSGADTGFSIVVGPEKTLKVDLQWAQPWNGVTTDLDAYLIRAGTRIAESESPNVEPLDQEPFEYVAWKNSSSFPVAVELVVNRCDTACGLARAAAHPAELGGTVGGDSGAPRLKFALLENGSGVESTEYPISKGGDAVGPTIFGHAGAAGAVSVAAVPAPIFFTGEPERYSSRGPVSHFFGPVLNTSPAPKLDAVEVLSKPDLAATDCGVTTFFGFLFEEEGGELTRRFCGTSAAAPHAAAVVALLLAKVPGATPGAVGSALIESATPVGGSGPCSVGAGLVDAVEAMKLLLAEEAGATAAVCNPPPGPGFEVTKQVETGGKTGGVHNPVESVAEIPSSSPPPVIEPSKREPSTFFRHHPRAVLRTAGRSAEAVFRFGSDEAGVAFLCKFDRQQFRVCQTRTVRRFRLGRHMVSVKAQSTDGGADSTPAVFRFRVVPVG
ncbi:MAG TPA: S8 family serine peptidase [Solirubrobacterales bacterium]